MRLAVAFTLFFPLAFTLPVQFARAETPICDTPAAQQEAADLSFNVLCAAWKERTTKISTAEMIAKTVLNCTVDGFSGGVKGVGMTFVDLGGFLKAALYDAPQWLWEKAKSAVATYWNDSPDAVSGASAAAEGNASEQRSILERARTMYAAFQASQAEVIKAFETGKDQMACLPPDARASVICEAVAMGVTYFLTGGIVVRGVRSTLSISGAMAEFLQSANRAENLKGLTATEKIKAASGMMGQMEERGKVLRKVGDSDLVEYANAKGEKYLKVEEYGTNVKGERSIISTREVAQDSKTGAIDANQQQGRELLKKAVQGKAGEDSSVIFVDVNNLGKTNYFKDGTRAGDDYLRGVGDAIKKSVGGEDMVFKLGGDEIAIVVKSKDPKVVERVATRVVMNVDRNHDARTVFYGEQVRQAEKYRAVNKAEKLEDVPAEITSNLSKAQAETAKKDFSVFKEEYLVRQAEAVREQAKYRPSVSIGSTVGKGDSLEDILQRAEAQATQTKIQYKNEMQLDTTKYGGTNNIEGRPNYKAKPKVLPTVE